MAPSGARSSRRLHCSSSAAATAFVILAAAASATVLQDTALSPEQQREFLRTAKIISAQPIGRGVTESLRLTLSDGKTTHDAAFQSIEVRTSSEDRRQLRRRAGELNFADSYKYNVAAYEMARLLGIDEMMPVTVQRRYRDRTGSLTWWVDNVLMDEAERESTDTEPPSPLNVQRQRMKMVVFAELVGDVDRNKGNVLYTKDWRVIMIDFTRAFRLHRTLRQPDTLTTIERGLWQDLQALTRDAVRRAVEANLTPDETAALMARHEQLVAHYTRLIQQRGEGVVVY